MAMLPSSSSSSSITYAFTYDVFISFTGCDTRHSFTGNLYYALNGKGIHTFIDDEELQKGEEITPALLEAIEKSRIAIVVLSKNYAFSSFCLLELSKILDCFKENCRLVWPVFYDVDPSDVRKQTGTYGEAMTLHMEKFKDNKEKLQNWRTALEQVADLAGWHFKHGDGSYEYKFIGKIVNEVSRKINRVALPIADYPVGLESQVRKVISLLDVGSNDKVHMVGIHGTGGIGKTTLALAVYNLLTDHFEGLCFLENVRENSKKYGLLHLQKTLLFAVLGEKEIEISSAKQGILIIQRRLHQKKVLLILDDVDKEDQLKHIIGRPDWLCPGSRVIITTRDKHLLSCHKVERTHEVEELNKNVAFELLRWKAFKDDKVRPSYADMLNRVVAYASGLPLALEVIGSNLYRKSIQDWESALEQYEKIQDKKIQKILQVSFDALEEQEQSVFLDIACCFKGYQFQEVKNILNVHHEQCIKYQIGVLVDKSLIRITHLDEVTLHDLIEDMGKAIVRRESPKIPGRRSRLWSHNDIVEVLEENTGTNKIEMMHLDSPLFEDIDWDGEAFKKMKNLKTLIIKEANFSKGPRYLPNSLRVLEWWKCPLQHLPCDFHPKKLSICKLPYSSFRSLEFLSSVKKLVTMKILNLDKCQSLTQIPDLSGVPNLEELSFIHCPNLITIHDSVGMLDQLKILNAHGCCQLRSFPPLRLPSLENIDFMDCSSLKKFPEILETMENITKIRLLHNCITEFPSSYPNFTQLRSLGVNHWLPRRSIVMMPQLAELTICDRTGRMEIEDEGEQEVSSMPLTSNLEYLMLSNCNLSDGSLALVLSWFPNLKELYLKWSKATILPECLKQCHFLWKLELYKCYQLQEIKGIPPSLEWLSVTECESLSLSCRSMLLKQELHEAGNTHYFHFPSLEIGRIPEWFEHQSMDGSISFWFRNNFPDNLLLCFAPPLPTEKDDCPELYFIINDEVYSYLPGSVSVFRGHIHLLNMLTEKFDHDVDEALIENEWNHVQVTIARPGGNSTDNEDETLSENELNHEEEVTIASPRESSTNNEDEALSENESNHVEVMSDCSEEEISLDIVFGIHLLKEESSMKDILFTNPYENSMELVITDSNVEEIEGDETSDSENNKTLVTPQLHPHLERNGKRKREMI